ncbi:MAG: hypothetical protein IJW53_05130 [Clostridia bacterium]|nr:hypothetical protein [Clostridia bacterium]
MSEKDKNTTGQNRGKKNGHYDLKTDAVNRLVNADSVKPLEPLGIDPGKKYRSGGLIDKIPSWLKAVFMKFWFNGAVCYFVLWGLGLFISNFENMLIILALVLGMVTDILVNNAFRFFAVTEGANDKWMMFPKKKLINLFLNIVYAFVILIIVVWFYNSLNGVLNMVNGTDGQIFIGVEPILFGLFYVVFDLAFIGMKNLGISIIRDAQNKNGV